MKYMTMAWWSGNAGPDSAADYVPYFASIKDQLPPSVRRLHEDVNLHDANLLTLDVNLANSLVSLRFHANRWRGPGAQVGSRYEVRLDFSDVRHFKSQSDPKTGLGGPHGYGDMGYDEIELLPDGFIEYRMLFSTGIEIHIQFKTLEITESTEVGPSTS